MCSEIIIRHKEKHDILSIHPSIVRANEGLICIVKNDLANKTSIIKTLDNRIQVIKINLPNPLGIFNIHAPAAASINFKRAFFKVLTNKYNSLSVLPELNKADWIIAGDFNITCRNIDRDPANANKTKIGTNIDAKLNKNTNTIWIDPFLNSNINRKGFTYSKPNKNGNYRARLDKFLITKSIKFKIHKCKIDSNDMIRSDHKAVFLNICIRSCYITKITKSDTFKAKLKTKEINVKTLKEKINHAFTTANNKLLKNLSHCKAITKNNRIKKLEIDKCHK